MKELTTKINRGLVCQVCELVIPPGAETFAIMRCPQGCGIGPFGTQNCVREHYKVCEISLQNISSQSQKQSNTTSSKKPSRPKFRPLKLQTKPVRLPKTITLALKATDLGLSPGNIHKINADIAKDLRDSLLQQIPSKKP